MHQVKLGESSARRFPDHVGKSTTGHGRRSLGRYEILDMVGNYQTGEKPRAARDRRK